MDFPFSKKDTQERVREREKDGEADVGTNYKKTPKQAVLKNSTHDHVYPTQVKYSTLKGKIMILLRFPCYLYIYLPPSRGRRWRANIIAPFTN